MSNLAYGRVTSGITSKIINTTAMILPQNIRKEAILAATVAISVSNMNSESQDPYTFAKNNIFAIAGLGYTVGNYLSDGEITKKVTNLAKKTAEYVGGDSIRKFTSTSKEKKHAKFVERIKTAIAAKKEERKNSL